MTGCPEIVRLNSKRKCKTSPASPVPSHEKSELLNSVRDEWERLGRPMSDRLLSPDEAVQTVVNHLHSVAAGGNPPHPAVPAPAASNPAASAALVPADPATAPAVTTVALEPTITTVYSLSCDANSVWAIVAIDTMSGQELASVALPPSNSGYYQLIYSEGEAYFSDGLVTSELVHVGDYMSQATQQSPALPPGVAAGSALLPGMPGQFAD